MINSTLIGKILLFGGLFLAACQTVTGEQALEDINAIKPSETYVAFEIPKGVVSPLPSFCPFRTGQDYGFPRTNKDFPVCNYGAQLSRIGKPFGDGFTLSNLAGHPSASVWFKRSSVESTDPSFGTFYFVKVRNHKAAEYFPSFFLTRGVVPLTGKVPVFKIDAGKVNYIGRWPSASRKLFEFNQAGVHEAMRASGVTIPSGGITFHQPSDGFVKCGKKSLFKKEDQVIEKNKRHRAGSIRCSIERGSGGV